MFQKTKKERETEKQTGDVDESDKMNQEKEWGED
jgi:hypothetical protein